MPLYLAIALFFMLVAFLCTPPNQRVRVLKTLFLLEVCAVIVDYLFRHL
jgi:hypothetical protein